MDRADNVVGLRGEEAEKLMLAGDGVRLSASRAAPRRPDASKDRQRAGVIISEPCRRFPRLFVGVFTERGPRNNAAAFRLQPTAPVWALCVADVSDGCAAE